MKTPSGTELRPVALRRILVAAALAVAACGVGNGGADGDPALTDTLRVLAYNIHHGEGMDSVLDLHRIAALIREVDPDLVAVQEVDSVTTRTGGVDQAAELGRLTEMEPRYGRFMPYQGGAYGMALLSRWPISQAVNVRLPEGAEPRSAMSVVVISPKSGRALRFVGIHFYRTAEERMAQAEALDRALAGGDTATILAGDFNSTPGSAVMARLSDSWSVVGKGEDHFTFPSYGPDREIDFVLFRPADAFEVISQRLIDEPVASDHRPVVVDLAWKP